MISLPPSHLPSMAALSPHIYTTFTFVRIPSILVSAGNFSQTTVRATAGLGHALVCHPPSTGRSTFKAATGDFMRRQPPSAPSSEAGLLRKYSVRNACRETPGSFWKGSSKSCIRIGHRRLITGKCCWVAEMASDGTWSRGEKVPM